MRSPPALAHFGLKSTILAGFSTVDGFDRTDRVSGEKPTAPIRLSRRSAAGQNVVHPPPTSRSRVGHKPDPWTPYLKGWLFSYGPRGGILTIDNLVKKNFPLVNWCCLC